MDTDRNADTESPPNRNCIVASGILALILSVSSKRHPIYAVRLNLNVKVLDFIQFGGPDLTIDSTIFEMWMDL